MLIEIKQAIEMCNIYSGILSGTMDAFASIISNNPVSYTHLDVYKRQLPNLADSARSDQSEALRAESRSRRISF